MLDVLIQVATAIDYSPLPKVGAENATMQSILSVIFGLAGVIALIFVAIGGLRLILANGDPSAVAKARGTIVYALIGLVVVISAFLIVSFILGML